MCDTLVSAPPGGPVWLAKNSDREPDEAQATELVRPGEPAPPHMSAGPPPPPPLRAPPRFAAAISRPVWLWGCEMGVNERGLGVANEAVFTRLPVPAAGLTGMDLQRHALEQCATAEEALGRIVALLAAHPQGGRMGHRGRLRYHSSFVLADPREAWILETAGPFWAARRVTAWTLSNALTIGADFDRVHPDAYAHARSRGWCRSAAEFSFARSFSAPLLSALAGAEVRRACTSGHLRNPPALAPLIAALRDHNGRPPTAGLTMTAPCAHARWLPTRAAGQTTNSMIARLAAPPALWFTGGPAPCLGVFKPVRLDAALADPRPPGERPDRSTWWRQHALHRAVLRDYAPLRARFAGELDALQRACLSEPASPSMCLETWSNHHEAAAGWLARAHAR
jgi:dipeptidase